MNFSDINEDDYILCAVDGRTIARYDGFLTFTESDDDRPGAAVLIDQALRRISDATRKGDSPPGDALADIDAGVDDVFDIKTPKNGKK